MKKRLPFILSLVVLVAGFGLVSLHRQTLKDYYVVMTTDLDESSLALKSSLPLTDKGSFLYETSQTELDGREAFNQACSSVLKEQSIVLGCYGGQRIFIFDVQDQRLAGVKEVTAAHELLHAGYERLSSTKRRAVDVLLRKQLALITDPHILETINQYKEQDDDTFANELHSIVGTELAGVSGELEEYYKQYFTDRSEVVALAEQYKQIFRDNEAAIAKLDTQLEAKKAEIDGLEAMLAIRRQNLQTESNQLQQLRSSNIPAYNAAVPSYNANVNQYNAGVALVKQLVGEYNQLVVQRNAVASTQNDLAGSLNSTAEPLQ